MPVGLYNYLKMTISKMETYLQRIKDSKMSSVVINKDFILKICINAWIHYLRKKYYKNEKIMF